MRFLPLPARFDWARLGKTGTPDVGTEPRRYEAAAVARPPMQLSPRNHSCHRGPPLTGPAHYSLLCTLAGLGGFLITDHNTLLRHFTHPIARIPSHLCKACSALAVLPPNSYHICDALVLAHPLRVGFHGCGDGRCWPQQDGPASHAQPRLAVFIAGRCQTRPPSLHHPAGGLWPRQRGPSHLAPLALQRARPGAHVGIAALASGGWHS